jgi:hypothetical protein
VSASFPFGTPATVLDHGLEAASFAWSVIDPEAP